MPPPTVNHKREAPSEQPTISFALLHQAGETPGLPGTSALVIRSAVEIIIYYCGPSKFVHRYILPRVGVNQLWPTRAASKSPIQVSFLQEAVTDQN